MSNGYCSSNRISKRKCRSDYNLLNRRVNETMFSRMLKKKLIYCCVSFCISLQYSQAQYHYLPLSRFANRTIESEMLDTNLSFHHSVRPFNRADIADAMKNWEQLCALPKKKAVREGFFGWMQRKFLDESLISIKNEDYWIEANMLLNLEIGFEETDRESPFINSRGVWIEGRLGEKFSFYTMVSENLGKFPEEYFNYYWNTYAVMGWGQINQLTNSGAVDFPMVMGGVCYNPSKYFTFSLDQGKNFFGEGYRSMILSDAVMPYANFKIETDFGKRVKYVNLYSVYLDPRSSVSVNGYDRKKYSSLHYLSWNVNSRLNLSLFESMIWVGDSTLPNQGLELHFFNPIIMYRQIEKIVGGKGGNAMIGLSSSYQVARGVRLYGQLVIDDFDIQALQQLGKGHWMNMYSGQLGIKVNKPFQIPNSFLRIEYNAARPFMYAHRTPVSNYTHSLMPLAHPWGSSFQELLINTTYNWNRWSANLYMSFGERAEDKLGFNSGNDLFQSIFDRQGGVLGYQIAGGEAYRLFSGEVTASYALNEISFTRLELGYRFRSKKYYNQELKGSSVNWFFFGFSTSLFERYYDF